MHHHERSDAVLLRRGAAPFAQILTKLPIHVRSGAAFCARSWLLRGRLYRRLPCAQPRRLPAARVARFARPPFRGLAEVNADLVMPAFARRHESLDFVVALPGPPLFVNVGHLLDE